MTKNIILNVENISKIYSKKALKALDCVSFSLFENEVVGLIGPNGAGKTTLIRIIMAYETPNEGKIEFLGKSTSDIEIRDKIGYQADLQYRSKTFTVWNYLKLHSELYQIENYEEILENFLKKFSLIDAKNKKLDSLSKGMRQKLELIIAFMNNPKLVILDEPTSALDPPSVFELRDFINEYKSNNNSILFSSHHLTEVEKICDRVIFIDEGKIISDVYLKNTEIGFLEKVFKNYETERRFI